ncbi:hypothetical protein B0H14DRAFT_2600531 [Mycena olivaceomarginata]|nr:hypothetical protein B0H14DRAFT_2600531 [Mycena olivaceomarginata]
MATHSPLPLKLRPRRCINEDTPNDKELCTKITSGHFQHLIVQPEQLKSFKGHLLQLTRLLNDPNFVKTIARVHVDEAHFIYTAGLPLYGLPAFRTPFQALSATFPPHIKSAAIENLNFDPKSLVSLALSCNRPNIIYATHCTVGSLSNVFHDDTQKSSDAASYQDALLPPELHNKDLIRHYHGGMLKAYLKEVLGDFSKDDSVCRILHGTEGLSTGSDVGYIDVVNDYGAPPAKPTPIQRGGRAGRRGQPSVYLLMAESWVYTASLDAVDPNSSDPDRLISGRLLKTSRKSERAGLAAVQYHSTSPPNHVVTGYIQTNPTFNSTNASSFPAATFTRTKAEPYTPETLLTLAIEVLVWIVRIGVMKIV